MFVKIFKYMLKISASWEHVKSSGVPSTEGLAHVTPVPVQRSAKRGAWRGGGAPPEG